MAVPRAPRNRTLSLSDEERELYRARLLFPAAGAAFEPAELTGKIVCSDLLTSVTGCRPLSPTFLLLTLRIICQKIFMDLSFLLRTMMSIQRTLKAGFPAS